MKLSRKLVLGMVLLFFCLIIHLYSSSEHRVERSYSTGFFVYFSRILRTLSGWLPFSFGDILYGLLIGWLGWKIARFFIRIFKKQPGTSASVLFKHAFYKTLVFCCSIYIIFNVFWGINYDRKGIAAQFGLELKKYSAEDLVTINQVLIEKINSSKLQWQQEKTAYPSNRQLFSMVSGAYKTIAAEYPFLKYEPASLKSSMWGWLGNYTGFTGYYNPFTGEAQLNTTIPKFLQPFVACHEVGHQLGYAKENEANFVGYLAAANSGNSLFQYSAYLDMFTYANRNLQFTDSVKAKELRKMLAAPVLADIKAWIQFNREHRSFVEPVISWVYGKYLQGNRQPGGILSYDEVTGFIIAYYKKFGRI